MLLLLYSVARTALQAAAGGGHLDVGREIASREG